MINIVLFEPEIPQNTGNIIRTCAALKARLHMIKPYGFEFTQESIKRYSVAYTEEAEIVEYDSLEDFFNKNSGEFYYITRYAQNTYSDITYSRNIKTYFVFGKESSGLPDELLKSNIEFCLRIPMNEKVRSLNVSNCVAIVGYEYMRQFSFENLSEFEIQKGRDYLLK